MHTQLLFIALVAVALAKAPKPIATAFTTWAVAINAAETDNIRLAIFALIAGVAALAAALPFPKTFDIALGTVAALLENTWIAYVALACGSALQLRK